MARLPWLLGSRDPWVPGFLGPYLGERVVRCLWRLVSLLIKHKFHHTRYELQLKGARSGFFSFYIFFISCCFRLFCFYWCCSNMQSGWGSCFPKRCQRDPRGRHYDSRLIDWAISLLPRKVCVLQGKAATFFGGPWSFVNRPHTDCTAAGVGQDKWSAITVGQEQVPSTKYQVPGTRSQSQEPLATSHILRSASVWSSSPSGLLSSSV